MSIRPSRSGPGEELTATESSTGTYSGDDVDWTTSPIGSNPSANDQWKQPVRVASTATLTVSTGLNAGDTVDGVTLVAGDRVLLKDQSTASQNGIYVAGVTPERAADMDDDGEVMGALVYVIAGTANGGKAYKNTNTSLPTVGSTSLTFTEFGAAGTTSFGTPANTYGTPAAGAASTAIRTDAVLPGPPIVILTLTNKSGGSVAAGDVVVIDTANDTAFTTTTTGQAEVSVGIAQATIANNASGAVLVQGYAALVNVPSSMTRGRYLETHTVAKQATGSATRRAGSFGQFLIAGTTPTAWLWGQTDQTASGSTSFTTPAIVLGTAAAAGAASTAIRSDSTIVAFDATVPVTQAFSDTAATGSAAFAARRDHKHGMPASPGGGGGASTATVPNVIQARTNGNAATSVTITAAAAGNRLILCTNSTTGQVTAPTCTNVTWTQLVTFTSTGSSFYAIWVGVVAGGSSGTSITMTKPGSFNTVAVLEVTDTLTPTLSTSATGNVPVVSGTGADVRNFARMGGSTAGRFIAMAYCLDNTGNVPQIFPGIPATGVFQSPGNTLVVGYSGGVGVSFGGYGINSAGASLIAEIT